MGSVIALAGLGLLTAIGSVVGIVALSKSNASKGAKVAGGIGLGVLALAGLALAALMTTFGVVLGHTNWLPVYGSSPAPTTHARTTAPPPSRSTTAARAGASDVTASRAALTADDPSPFASATAPAPSDDRLASLDPETADGEPYAPVDAGPREPRRGGLSNGLPIN